MSSASTIDLSGQVALITGANRGIGAEIARALGAAGTTVALSARRRDSLEDLATSIRADGGRCSLHTLDVLDESSVFAAVAEVLEEHGQIDLLVNNAGIGAGAEHPWEQPVEEFWSVFEVNVRGPFLVSQAVLPAMTARGSGRIVDVGSMVADSPDPTAAPYAASKAALFRWNSALAAGTKAHGVSVFIISPGLVHTDMTSIDRFASIPDEHWVPIEKTGALLVQLASGRADALSGRFIHATDDLDRLLAAAEQIEAENLQTLGIRLLDS